MPKVNKKILILTAGVMLSVVGIMLFSKAIRLRSVVSSDTFPKLVILGVILGLIKMYFVFRKIIKKNIDRINKYDKKKVCFFAFQKWQSYVLIIVMIGLGIFMSKASFIPREVLLTVDATVGTALFTVSYYYYRNLF